MSTDRELLEAFARDRKESLFRELYRRHSPQLYRVALRLLGGSAAEAEEVVHDVWLRACRGLAEFQGRSSVGTWLTGIALNRCREIARRRRSDQGPSIRSEVTEQRGAERLAIVEALGLLADGYREVLLLHDVEGFSHEEIGEILGVASGTSKSQLFSARRALRALLGEEERHADSAEQ